jgi:hypothetical protein
VVGQLALNGWDDIGDGEVVGVGVESGHSCWGKDNW